MKKYRVWHPLGTVSVGQEHLNIISGDRIYVQDSNGKTYIDGLCGLWNMSLGYNNKKIINKITEQLMEIPYVNLCEFTNSTVQELANKLIYLLHRDIEKIYFTCTGSESNELAIKIIRKYHALKGNYGKKKIGVIASSYHGSYYGSLSASQFESKNKSGYGPFLDDFITFDLPFCRCCKSGVLSSECLDVMIKNLKKQFEEEKDMLAGFIIEPIIGSGGIIPLPYEYLTVLSKLCTENDVILVYDEVATGFGRTGKMFTFEKHKINPDIVCMSKGINSGYLPMGAVAINKKIYEVFKVSSEALFHLSTQNGNPVCCAAALATIEQLEEDDRALVCYVEKMGEFLKSQLMESLMYHPNVYDIRGEGFMLAIDLVESKFSNEILQQNNLLAIVQMLKRNGLVTEACYNPGTTSSIIMFLAFIITQDEIKNVVNIIKKTLTRLT
ncbi:aspartate aminotransferase family protein [Clostridium gasigenes]|uniref:aminotransferase family protein n=1 Tax=Clostridium gasigenes TaxID=94869 RepID=UPI001C0B14C7|nr:aspartate aminotransferase family protein [Clostridium gasigenes]MBU3089198.1 aspartate aminotransferase family protein [Clostridium gasigenes]